MNTTVPRGIRNNNPGNIRLGQAWQGLEQTQTDQSFCQFVTPEYGIRAIMKIMITYHKEGVETINDIISKWAPPNENDTVAYIKAVSQDAGIDPNIIVDVHDVPVMVDIIKGIITHENGCQPYPDDTIINGIKLALS